MHSTPLAPTAPVLMESRQSFGVLRPTVRRSLPFLLLLLSSTCSLKFADLCPSLLPSSCCCNLVGCRPRRLGTIQLVARHFFVRECVENGEIVVPYVNTLDNEADFFTKPLEGKLFFELRNRIMNVAPAALGGLARSYRASVQGGVLDAVRARVCAVRSGMSNAASYLGMCAERSP